MNCTLWYLPAVEYFATLAGLGVLVLCCLLALNRIIRPTPEGAPHA